MWVVSVEDSGYDIYRPIEYLLVVVKTDEELREFVREYFWEVVQTNIVGDHGLSICLGEINRLNRSLSRNIKNILLRINKNGKHRIRLYSRWIMEYNSSEWNSIARGIDY